MSRVAIIGSCITRDLWPIRGDGNEGLLYISRTSLPSLLSPAVSGFEAFGHAPPALTPSQQRAVAADLGKTALNALVAHRPTHIIFDFIDERFDLLSISGALGTHSWELEVSGYLDLPAFAGRRTIKRTGAACGGLWAAAAGELAALIAATPLSEARILLHQARWAERHLDAEGREQAFPDDLEIFEGRPASLTEHNRLLADYETLFLSLLPNAVRVAAPDRRLADARHQWGLSPFHYVDDYYQEIRAQLAAAGVSFPRETARPALPSAPAA